MNCEQHSGVQPCEESVMLGGLLGTRVQEYAVRDAEINSFIIPLLLAANPSATGPQRKETAPHSSSYRHITSNSSSRGQK